MFLGNPNMGSIGRGVSEIGNLKVEKYFENIPMLNRGWILNIEIFTQKISCSVRTTDRVSTGDISFEAHCQGLQDGYVILDIS